MKINFERLVSRNISIFLTRLLSLSGMEITLEKLLEYGIIGFFMILIASASALFVFAATNAPVSVLGGLAGGLLYIIAIYSLINYNIDKRKTKMEAILPDYFQLVSANLRSGMAIDRSMLVAARPEFEPFSGNIQDMNNRLFSGESLETVMIGLANSYRSNSLTRSVRLIIEAERYGGKMADLMEEISRDLRGQQIVQKEIASQLFMYSIFIAFAGLIAAPVLYGLTSQMIKITDSVWTNILATNPGGLPSTGTSFLTPQPPLITIQQYHTFSFVAIAIITGFAAIIMAAINSGKPIRGLRYLPIFIIVGILIFLIVGAAVGSLFGSIGG